MYRCSRGVAHAIKARVSTGGGGGGWSNEVQGPTARIAVNSQTPRDNAAVRSGFPIHLLTFSSGADTMYWGRYVCVKVGNDEDNFHLKRIDQDHAANQLLSQMAPPSEEVVPEFRSRLESCYDQLFQAMKLEALYEPITLRVLGREYTPDFMIREPPHAPLIIEIKGAVVDEELLRCAAVAELGFHVALLFGSADLMSDETCFQWMPYCKEPQRKLPALLRRSS